MALVGVGIAMQLRKGTGELLGLTHLADELEEG
jgi:hypothetical protein